MSDALLRAEHVGVSVGRTRLLHDVSAEFQAGMLTAIVGANGAGKSTLLRVLGRQLTPTSGAVMADGRPLSGWDDRVLAQRRALLSQSVELAFPLRVSEVVMMGRYPHTTGRPTARDRQACDEAMARFDVSAWADRNYLTLSGGERQRVQFARVLAQLWFAEPGVARFLLLDEPLTFLDVRHQVEFLAHVRSLLADPLLVVVAVLHDLGLAARHADQVLVLSEGVRVAHGPPAVALTDDVVEQAFGVRPKVAVDDAGGRHFVFG